MSVVEYIVVAGVLGISTLGYVLMYVDLRKRIKK